MSSFTDSGPPGPTKGAKRKFVDIYDSSKETFPNDPWYALDHDYIMVTVRDMCDKLITSLRRYESVDRGIKDLLKGARDAKNLPSVKQCRLAVLGEQGKGKSSLINALLDHKLLDTSGGSAACTAFATIILHKEGSIDHTKNSDVKIEFWSMEEIGIRIKEQMDRRRKTKQGRFY